ncbi:Tetratricopeptide repeat-containing protein [Gracilibacillus orientalis]|uniref:Tetratricopeptide repeat-containing protein n=1 Tax=Gracilibacillus orientalis TaxID=334253 RepID=A0A1I4PH08_9BACI|nr:Tetratricopeptide repeat-containing protein [Gracilibacillus orientalis]
MCKYRKKLNWTQGELAKKVNTSTSMISKIESGKYHPPEKLMSKILKVLNIKELTYPEYHPLIAQLTSWQQSIVQRNYATANKHYKELQKFPISYFYNQLALYSLCNFQQELIYFRTDQASKFLEDVQKYADTLSPVNNYPYIKAIGLYYLLLDQLKDAFTYFNVAIKMNPDLFEKDGEIHLYYAFAYDKIGQALDSTTHATTALSIFQSKLNQPNILLSRIVKIKNTLRSQNQPIQETIQELHDILDNYTSIHTNYIYYLLSIAYFQNNDFEHALKYNKKAIRHEKISALKVRYIFFIAYVYALLKDDEMALTVIEGGISINKDKKYEYFFYLLKGIIQGTHGTEAYRQKVAEEIIPYFQLKGNMLEKNYCHAILGDVYYHIQFYKEAANQYYIYPGNSYISELLTKYPQK